MENDDVFVVFTPFPEGDRTFLFTDSENGSLSVAIIIGKLI